MPQELAMYAGNQLVIHELPRRRHPVAFLADPRVSLHFDQTELFPLCLSGSAPV